MDVVVKVATKVITLHAEDMTIHSVSASDGQQAHFSMSDQYNFLVLTFDKPLLPGNVSLTFSFTGNLNDKMVSFVDSTRWPFSYVKGVR